MDGTNFDKLTHIQLLAHIRQDNGHHLNIRSQMIPYSINYEFVPSPLPSRYRPNVTVIDRSILLPTVTHRYSPLLTVTHRYSPLLQRYPPLLIVSYHFFTVSYSFEQLFLLP